MLRNIVLIFFQDFEKFLPPILIFFAFISPFDRSLDFFKKLPLKI